MENKIQKHTIEQKYNKALELLREYTIPCEIDGFMDENDDYCSRYCGVDDEIFKTCWDKFIEWKLSKEKR